MSSALPPLAGATCTRSGEPPRRAGASRCRDTGGGGRGEGERAEQAGAGVRVAGVGAEVRLGVCVGGGAEWSREVWSEAGGHAQGGSRREGRGTWGGWAQDEVWGQGEAGCYGSKG